MRSYVGVLGLPNSRSKTEVWKFNAGGNRMFELGGGRRTVCLPFFWEIGKREVAHAKAEAGRRRILLSRFLRSEEEELIEMLLIRANAARGAIVIQVCWCKCASLRSHRFLVQQSISGNSEKETGTIIKMLWLFNRCWILNASHVQSNYDSNSSANSSLSSSWV